MVPDGDDLVKWTYYDVNTAPRTFEIVLCRFPFPNNPSLPPKRRSPCLVRRLRIHKSEPKAFVSVVYGTTNTKAWERGAVDLIVSNTVRMQQCGLWQATRFDFATENTVELPWATEWFPIPDKRLTPTIGALDDDSVDEIVKIMTHRKEIGFWG